MNVVNLNLHKALFSSLLFLSGSNMLGAAQKLSVQDLIDSGRSIESYSQGCMPGCISLKNLGITDLKGLETVKDPSSVTMLDLCENKISELPPKFFAIFSNLQHLNLAYNQIKAIKKEHFSGLTQVDHILLRNNQIESAENDSFEGLDSLIYVSLSHNNLSAEKIQILRRAFSDCDTCPSDTDPDSFGLNLEKYEEYENGAEI